MPPESRAQRAFCSLICLLSSATPALYRYAPAVAEADSLAPIPPRMPQAADDAIPTPAASVIGSAMRRPPDHEWNDVTSGRFELRTEPFEPSLRRPRVHAT